MNTFFTSDWHLGEDRFELMSRPFQDIQQHIDFLVTNHNSLVKENDKVYVNGDVVYQKADKKYLEQVSRFNGRKTLVRGNHDRIFSDDELKLYFEEIIPEGGGVELQVEGINCYLTHYPTMAKKDKFNLVGHIHSAWKFQLNSFNVGVDVNNFFPVCSSQIPKVLNAITNFYDFDVWAAYNEVNQSFLDTRGKKTQYFTKND